MGAGETLGDCGVGEAEDAEVGGGRGEALEGPELRMVEGCGRHT